MSVGRICSHHVDLADGEETVQAAARRMTERRITTLIVLNRANEPVGIVTDRDLIVRVLAQGKDPREARVDEVMTRSLMTVSEATSIEHALALMRAGEFRRLPVTGGDGILAGLVTLDQILRFLAERFVPVGAPFDDEAPTGTDVSRLRRRAAV
jgi:CBS domain-containing protein